MKQTIDIEGHFDNGRASYRVIESVPFDETKTELEPSDIVDIVQALKRKDRFLHGKSYRGDCVAFEVASHEIDNYADKNNWPRNECGNVEIPDSHNFLNVYRAVELQIINAFLLA